MNYIYKKLAHMREQSKNKLVVYTTSAYNLTGNWDKMPLPYHVWQDQSKNLKLRYERAAYDCCRRKLKIKEYDI